MFRLPNKVKSISDISEDRIIDATESKIDRPKRKQERWYSGKKKQHTIKTQIEVGVDTMIIYSVRFAKVDLGQVFRHIFSRFSYRI